MLPLCNLVAGKREYQHDVDMYCVSKYTNALAAFLVDARMHFIFILAVSQNDHSIENLLKQPCTHDGCKIACSDKFDVTNTSTQHSFDLATEKMQKSYLHH